MNRPLTTLTIDYSNHAASKNRGRFERALYGGAAAPSIDRATGDIPMTNKPKTEIDLDAEPGRGADVKERSWLLFNLIVGGELSRRPRSLELADDIEWLVSTRGFEPGVRLGTERELAQHFSVGPRVVRQACRSLTARGTIEPRRGNAGGFIVAETSEGRVVDAFVDALPANGNRDDAIDALKTVGATLGQQRGAAAQFALSALRRASEGGPRSVASPCRSGLAETIARKIESDLEFWTHACGIRTGVLEAMSERYEVSVALIVQAVRLLEDCGVLQLRKGRLGGIDLTAERNSAQAILAANAYFATHSVSIADCDSLVRMLNIAIIERAARCESVSLDSIEQALSAMRHADDPTAVGMQWYALQRALSERAGNAPLHLLVKCLAAYVVRVRTCRSSLDDAQAGTLVGASERIVANMRRGSTAGSAEAHLACQEALGASW
jgi:DNA-binding FadR family transcriptional regulator